jgi:hypothetical protein
MSVSAPFSPCGNTVVITATTTATTPVQVASSTLGGNQYRVINSGAVVVILGYGQTNSNPISYRSYTGLSETQVTTLLNNEGQTSFSFIDVDEYNLNVAALNKQL